MNFNKIIASEDDNNRRCDRVLRKFLKQENLSSIYSALRKGLIKVNEKKVKADAKIQSGDEILIADFLMNKKSEESNTTENISFTYKLDTVYCDKNIKIIDKAYDIPVQAARKNEVDIAGILKQGYTLQEGQKSLSFTPAPLHRLDRRTSGLLICSQSIAGAQWISLAIKNHLLRKSYIAILEGKILKDEQWTDYIDSNKKIEKSGFKTTFASKNTDEGKIALTKIFPVCCGKWNNIDISLCRLDIKTGRTHQIRAQSALHLHPLLGDFSYGGTKIAPELKSPREHFLHAMSLSFPEKNPLGIPSEIKSPFPKDFLYFDIFSDFVEKDFF